MSLAYCGAQLNARAIKLIYISKSVVKKLVDLFRRDEGSLENTMSLLEHQYETVIPCKWSLHSM